MPPLSQTLRKTSPKGFVAVEEDQTRQPALTQPGRMLGGNPYLRCPLPPFNAGPDTLRQFNESGKVPARRVIPLPIESESNGSVTNVANTTVIQSGGSGGGSSTLVSTSVQISVPSLAPGQTFMMSAAILGTSFKLNSVSTGSAFEVRLYGDAITQGSDIARATDTAVMFEVVPGIITDIVFDTPPYVWNWQNRIAQNADSPQASVLYVTVINPSLVVATGDDVVVINYLPLE